MRYFVGFVFALALAASPRSVSAQGTDDGWVEEFYPELAPKEPPQPPPREPAPKREGTTPEPSGVQEPAPASEPAPEEPALQIELDTARVAVAPTALRTADGYTLAETKLRVRRAKIGLGVSALALGAGVGMALGAAAGSICISFGQPCSTPGWVAPVGVLGGILTAGGLAGVIASSVLLRRRKRDQNYLSGAHYGTPRRVQWDVAQSRLVF